MGDKPDYINGEPKPVPNNLQSMHDRVSADLQSRKEYGLKKYDSLLQPFNGRNFLQDIYEEMQDGIVYISGALAEQQAVEIYLKKILTGWVKMYDLVYPEDTNQVIMYITDWLPGWLVKIHEEVLGDRFIYQPANAEVPEGSR
jgi:hypothetical protein